MFELGVTHSFLEKKFKTGPGDFNLGYHSVLLQWYSTSTADPCIMMCKLCKLVLPAWLLSIESIYSSMAVPRHRTTSTAVYSMHVKPVNNFTVYNIYFVTTAVLILVLNFALYILAPRRKPVLQ